MRPTYAEIHLPSVKHNLTGIRKRIGQRPLIMAVVKANAYGHGIVPVSQFVERQKLAQFFGVAIVEEGILLRQHGIKNPILSFTAPFENQLPLFLNHNIAATICSLSAARKLNALARKNGKKAVVHVKVDTGMGRIGVPLADSISLIREILPLSNIIVGGLYTHFATSDEPVSQYAGQQLDAFRSVIEALDDFGIKIPLIHCANSAAILQMENSYFDMVRPGIMMYGHYPNPLTQKSISIHPAMSLKSKVSFLKRVPMGTSISYGCRYITTEETTIVSVPIGYADGLNRRLTNSISAIINGKKYPVVGTICMDQVMIDAGSSSKIKIGDTVTFIGKEKRSIISVSDYASALGTIPYEVCCAISDRVPRKYDHGKR